MSNRILFVIFAIMPLFAGSAYAQRFKAESGPQKVFLRPAVPKPLAPPSLDISGVTFHDHDGNLIINADERCSIRFTITNTGEGAAYRVQPRCLEIRNVAGISIALPSVINEIKPRESREVEISMASAMNLGAGGAEFVLRADAAYDFSAPEQVIIVDTKPFEPPRIQVADYKFSTRDGGIPVTGETITMQILVQNKGNSTADDVKADIRLPKDVFMGSESPVFDLGSLRAGESKVIEVPVFTNNRFSEPRLSISVALSEKYGKYAVGENVSVDMRQSMAKTVPVTIQGDHISVRPAENMPASLHSDVDVNIPRGSMRRGNVFALIIGNEFYIESKEIDVPFARNDAIIFSQYVNKTLGVPAENIAVLTDASKLSMANQIERLCRLADTYTGKDSVELIFYYAGHGMHDDEKRSYLIPVDVPGTKVEQGIELSEVYRMFGESPAAKATILIDACFSGRARAGELLASRGIAIVPNKDYIPGNVVVFTASSGNQAALSYKEKHHGMFTYYLLKKLQMSSGDVTYDELSSYVFDEVRHNSYKANNAEQTPDILIGTGAKDRWVKWKL